MLYILLQNEASLQSESTIITRSGEERIANGAHRLCMMSSTNPLCYISNLC